MRVGGIQAAAEMENTCREAVGGHFFQPEADPLLIGRMDDSVTFCLISKHGLCCPPHSGVSRSPVGSLVLLFFFGGGGEVEGSCVSTRIIHASVSLPDGGSVR